MCVECVEKSHFEQVREGRTEKAEATFRNVRSPHYGLPTLRRCNPPVRILDEPTLFPLVHSIIVPPVSCWYMNHHWLLKEVLVVLWLRPLKDL